MISRKEWEEKTTQDKIKFIKEHCILSDEDTILLASKIVDALEGHKPKRDVKFAIDGYPHYGWYLPTWYREDTREKYEIKLTNWLFEMMYREYDTNMFIEYASILNPKPMLEIDKGYTDYELVEYNRFYRFE